MWKPSELARDLLLFSPSTDEVYSTSSRNTFFAMSWAPTLVLLLFMDGMLGVTSAMLDPIPMRLRFRLRIAVMVSSAWAEAAY